VNARQPHAAVSALESDLASRIRSIDWQGVAQNLDTRGSALIEGMLTRAQCDALSSLYADEQIFRSRIVMQRHAYGRGEYKYFAYPLPELVAGLRGALYPRLAPIANRWNASLGIDARFPDEHADFIERCQAAGQVRPTPLLLHYEKDDYNCLSTANTCFRCRSRFCCRSRSETSPAANSSSPSSARACSRVARSSRCGRVTRWPSPCIIGPYRERGAYTGSISATA
jgi:hypothetical protein